jgi:hypothetical protein
VWQPSIVAFLANFKLPNFRLAYDEVTRSAYADDRITVTVYDSDNGPNDPLVLQEHLNKIAGAIFLLPFIRGMFALPPANKAWAAGGA